MKILLTLLLSISTLCCLSIEKIKFGKIEKSDLEMQSYDKDSSAVAVILYEYGTSRIDYQQGLGWKLVFTKHQRIKILKKEGVEYANFQIRLNKNNTDEEDLYGLKAITFNLENNKIVKTELDKEDVLLENVNKYNDLKSFTLPNVKVGSVIDVKYNIDCKMFFRNMRTWYFQHYIPTLYSEYEVIIPEYFNFRKFALGFESYSLQDENETHAVINLSSSTRTQSGSTMSPVKTEYNYDNISFNNRNYHWIAEEMPAFVEEAYVSTADNYIQQINFELETVQFPNSKLYTYSKSWDSINEDLKLDEDFGKIVFSNANFLEDKALELVKGKISDEEKVLSILHYVQNNFKFNDNYSIYSKGLRKVEKDMNGNVADINFYLAALLRSVGFEVYPVVLSTRSNGVFLFPTVTGFNYVVLQCTLGDKKILLDGANKYCGLNEIPFYCINGKGMVIGGSEPDWIDLYELGDSNIYYVSQMTMGPEGEVSGSLKINRSGYSANIFRNKVGKFVSTEEYISDFEEGKPDWEIKNHKVANLEVMNKIVSEEIDLKLNNNCIVAGDRIYFNPVFFNPEDENPFKLKERKYPVDFGYKIQNNTVSVINIPEGYEVEEMPESVKIAMPDKKVEFYYGISKINGNMIQVVSTVKFNQPVYLAEDYENLKTIFNRVIEKHQQQIILKKI